MKTILTLVMGMGLVLSLGMAYAEEGMSAEDTGSKMIRNEDLERLDIDQDRATINQIPAESGLEESAPGGVREKPEGAGADIEQGEEAVDKGPIEPGAEGTGEEGKTPERSRY